MSIPSVPQKEPQESKDIKKSLLNDSFISIMKKGYDKATAPQDTTKKKKNNLLNNNVIDPDTSFEIWKYPN